MTESPNTDTDSVDTAVAALRESRLIVSSASGVARLDTAIRSLAAGGEPDCRIRIALGDKKPTWKLYGTGRHPTPRVRQEVRSWSSTDNSRNSNGVVGAFLMPTVALIDPN